MATKFKYMSNDCLSVDATLPQLVCGSCIGGCSGGLVVISGVVVVLEVVGVWL